jgi:beta-lactamase regulating signal transducer with metallopeptidase domain
MQDSQPVLLMFFMVSWGVTTAVLAILVIYRGTLSSKEDDQIFIDAAEQHHYQEQQAVIAKMSRLTKPIIALAVISGVLLLTSAGLWIYGGLKSF